MSKGLRTGVLAGGLLFVAAAGGAAGYCIGEQANNMPRHEVEQAKNKKQVAEVGYLSVAQTGTCEYQVLKTTLEVSPKFSYQAEVIKPKTLDQLCGDEPDHTQIAESASRAYGDIIDARYAAYDREDYADYTPKEKTIAILLGSVCIPLSVAGLGVGVVVLARAEL